MNFDITWCSGKGCKKRETCERWVRRLDAWASNNGYPQEKLIVSVAEFSGTNGECSLDEKDRKRKTESS